MSRIVLDDALRADYLRLFQTCQLREDRTAEVEHLIDQVLVDQTRYQTVAKTVGVPWFVVAALHSLETGRDFTCHLHNGDPLFQRTQHLPDGRPVSGEPPFEWEESASDALRLRHFDQWTDWSIAGTLFKLESYDNWGYRLYHPETASPYLWSGSQHYTLGKYVTADSWSETAVFQGIGTGVLLRRMAERSFIDFPDSVAMTWPVVRFGEAGPWAAELQMFLNRLPGVFVKVDGWPGSKTSAAFFKLSGRYLPGDPREVDSGNL